MKSMLKKIFFKLLGERKKDYIRVILSGIFCISVVFFSTSVGSSLVYISTGRRATMTELVMEVEKNFILPYVLLIFLMILIILGYIRKRSSDYAMLNILGIKKKHRYMYIGCEYLGIILGSIAGGLILGILEAMIVKKILENIFQNYVSNIYLGISPLILTLIISVIMFGIGFAFCDQYIACIGIDHIVSGGSNHNRASKNRVNQIIICNEHIGRFGANKALTMTLIPTMNCNFRCPYCYEKDKKYPVKKMTTEVMDYSSCKKGRVKL